MNQPFAFNKGKPIVTERAGVTVKKAGVHLGAEVSGIDLRKPLSDAQFEAVDAALVEHELLIFRDQDISSDDLMRFGRRFNPPGSVIRSGKSARSARAGTTGAWCSRR